jgi:phosphatidate cytidylyltransferase
VIKRRVLSALIFVPILGVAIFTRFFPLLVLLIVIASLVEFYRLSFKELKLFSIIGVLGGVLIGLCGWLGGYTFAMLGLVGAIFLIITNTLLHNVRSFTQTSITLFGTLYIGWLLTHLILLKNLPNGSRFLVALFLITWLTDTAAYGCGVIWGRHRVVPQISPKKTLEGFIGGLVSSILVALSIKFLRLIPQMTLLHSLILGSLLGGIGQIGDLFESLIKRDAGVKNSSSLVPGHGGVLDVFDSIIFTAPVMFYYSKFFLG